MLRKWNARDCYNDMNSFIAGYMNIIIDKNKEKSDKSQFKTSSQDKAIIDGLSALVECLTYSFSTNNTTLLLHILRVNEDKA